VNGVFAEPRPGRPAAGVRIPEERGRLEIQPAVLRKIVEYTADQVPGTLRHERRLAGIDVGEVGSVAKVVTGVGDASTVDVALELTLQYPAVVRTVIDAVRAAVGAELDRTAGYRLRAFTVTVSGFRGAGAPSPARIQ
jgi:uncharacterized alkaline shock family protein YloU